MILKIKGQLYFCYGCPKKCLRKCLNLRWQLYNKDTFKYIGSLLGILIGVFLLPQTAFFSDITPEKIIELTNIERSKNNLNSLTANQLLTQAAYKKGEAILRAGKFQHNIDDIKFSQWIKDTGYKYSYVGENLAIDFNTSEGAIEAWLNSETHKRNLLNPYYEEIGIATLEDKFKGQDTILIIQIFGTPPKSIMQPTIKGIDNQNFFTSNNYSILPVLNYKNENFLTHSISNNTNSDLALASNQPIYNTNLSNSSVSNVNNFFEQYPNLLNLNIINVLFITFYTLLVLLISYLYYYYFSYLTRLL
ncbi:MAG: CAP domain-containing protein [Patescibacteria group bacterium]